VRILIAGLKSESRILPGLIFDDWKKNQAVTGGETMSGLKDIEKNKPGKGFASDENTLICILTEKPKKAIAKEIIPIAKTHLPFEFLYPFRYRE